MLFYTYAYFFSVLTFSSSANTPNFCALSVSLLATQPDLRKSKRSCSMQRRVVQEKVKENKNEKKNGKEED